MKNRIYICGPINSPIPHPHTPDVKIPVGALKSRFFRVERYITDHYSGWEPVNPLRVNVECFRESVVSGNGCGGPFDGHHFDCWMRGDIRALMTCHAIALLPDWQQSTGATMEDDLASRLGFHRVFAEINGRVTI